MAIARHGEGVGPALRALGSQIHPVFMLPPLAASWFGSILAGEFSLARGSLHMLAIFCSVYTAHVKDGYIDFHVRGEDDEHPLSVHGCHLGLWGAGLGMAICLVGLYGVVGVGAVVLTAPGYVIGYFHAPQLDTNPITATLGYPTGIGLAIVGGFYTQVGQVANSPVAFAMIITTLLAGVKIIDDAQDYDYDRSISKRTVAVTLGLRGARLLAYGLFGIALLGVVILVWMGVVGPSGILAIVAFGIVALIARQAEPALATKLLIRAAYLFLAGLVMSVWFQPLS